MNTAEMWLEAQEDGKVYEIIGGDVAYSKEFGLTSKYDFSDSWGLEAWEDEEERGLDILLGYEWKIFNG